MIKKNIFKPFELAKLPKNLDNAIEIFKIKKYIYLKKKSKKTPKTYQNSVKSQKWHNFPPKRPSKPPN